MQFSNAYFCSKNSGQMGKKVPSRKIQGLRSKVNNFEASRVFYKNLAREKKETLLI